MNLAPRQQFQEDTTAAKFHRELVVLDRFRDALHASLLEQVLALPQTYSVEEAAAAYHRIMGAKDFIFYLLNIAEERKPLPGPPSANLNHRT